MEARLAGHSSTLSLLVPHHSIAPIADRFSARDDEPPEADHADQLLKMRRAVGRVDMMVRAEVAAIEMPIEEVLALQPGDVLSLGAPADGGSTLFADETPVQLAKPGRSGTRRAVQITGKAGGAA